MRCKEVMVPRDELITVSRTTTVLEAMEVMVTNRVGSVLIIDGDESIGIATSKDLMNVVVINQEKGLDKPVSEVMSTKLLTISEKDTLRNAVSKMNEFMTHHILVKDGEGKISGLISSFDIVREVTLSNLHV